MGPVHCTFTRTIVRGLVCAARGTELCIHVTREDLREPKPQN